MAKLTPAQILAVEAVMKPHIADPAISVMGLFLEALDAYTLAGPQKRSRLARGAVRLPDGIPDAEQRLKARAAWRDVGRHDLCDKIDMIAEEFRSYHLARGTTMESWAHAWATWYRRQPEFHKPSGQLELVAAAYEETTAAGWLRRLETFFGLLDADKWTWRKSWGPNPFEEGHKIPESVRAEFKASNPSLITKKVRAEYLEFISKTG